MSLNIGRVLILIIFFIADQFWT